MNKSELLVHVITVIDGQTESLVNLLELKGFVASDYHQQFDVDPIADPDMLDRYSIGPDDVAFLVRHAGVQVNFDFERFAYFIEAAQRD